MTRGRLILDAVTYNMPVVPSLFSELSMGADAGDVAIYGPNAHILAYNQTFQLTVINWDTGKHPLYVLSAICLLHRSHAFYSHLHGHKFAVMHMSWDVASNDPTLNPPFQDNLTNPLWRDTIRIPPGGSVTLRIRTDNPGTWFFHCHIEWHLEAGLAFTFFEAPTLAQQLLKPPQSMYDQCATQGIPYTGNAAGHNSTTDLSGLNVGK
jgi:iron transport multicopper oxidase